MRVFRRTLLAAVIYTPRVYKGSSSSDAAFPFNRVLFLSVSGLFFILPCMDTYIPCDLRTVTFDVPPQEVGSQVRAHYSCIMTAFSSVIATWLNQEQYEREERSC